MHKALENGMVGAAFDAAAAFVLQAALLQGTLSALVYAIFGFWP